MDSHKVVLGELLISDARCLITFESNDFNIDNSRDLFNNLTGLISFNLVDSLKSTPLPVLHLDFNYAIQEGRVLPVVSLGDKDLHEKSPVGLVFDFHVSMDNMVNVKVKDFHFSFIDKYGKGIVPSESIQNVLIYASDKKTLLAIEPISGSDLFFKDFDLLSLTGSQSFFVKINKQSGDKVEDFDTDFSLQLSEVVFENDNSGVEFKQALDLKVQL
jgi:hypothetical protein